MLQTLQSSVRFKVLNTGVEQLHDERQGEGGMGRGRGQNDFISGARNSRSSPARSHPKAAHSIELGMPGIRPQCVCKIHTRNARSHRQRDTQTGVAPQTRVHHTEYDYLRLNKQVCKGPNETGSSPQLLIPSLSLSLSLGCAFSPRDCCQKALRVTHGRPVAYTRTCLS